MEMFLSGIQGLGLKAVTVSQLWNLAHPDLPTGAAPGEEDGLAAYSDERAC